MPGVDTRASISPTWPSPLAGGPGGTQMPELQRGLLRRIADRMTSFYREQLRGETLAERMEALADLFPAAADSDRGSASTEGELPYWSLLACPYPDLADQDRTVCAMERLLISDLLDHPVSLG